MTSQASARRADTAPPQRLRAVVVLAVAALLATLAPPAAAQGDSPWPSYQADAGNTRQAEADGPSDPGVKWLRDLAEPEPGDAAANADGWGLRVGRSGQGMPVVGPDGELLLRASSNEEDTGDVLLALDPDDGLVQWEYETDSLFRNPCEPAVDSQGRVWIQDFTGDETKLVGLDAASGNVLVSLEDGEDGNVPACTRSTLLLGGQGDGERLVIPGRSGEPGDVVAVDVSADDGDVGVDWTLDDDGDIAEVLGTDSSSRSDSFAMSDDQLFLGVRTGEDDDGTVELAAFDLDDGSVAARVGLPTPPAEDDEDPADHDVNDYGRLRMLVADDTLVLGPEDAEFDHLVAYDVSDGLTDGQSHLWLERDETMGRWAMSSQGDTVVTLAGPRPSRDLVGRSLADGSEQWRKDSTTGTQENIIPVGADGGLFVRQSGGDIAGLAPDGMREWFFTPDGLAAALGVDELEEVGYSSANTVIGPIDGEGTLYFASRSANRDALLAIDSSGGLDEAECGASFVDVSPGNAHACDIDEMLARGITEGVGGDRYAPRGTVTRAEFATFLVRALEIEPLASGPFVDIDGYPAHRENINAAFAEGITRGVSETAFAPGRQITRAEVAALLARAFELEPVASGPFEDVDDSIHVGDINAAFEAGITNGVSATRFAPERVLPRDQMASLLIRALDQAEDL